jgi:hypothetical protein
VTKLCHKDGCGNDIGGGGGCRDGDREQEKNYVDEVLVEAKNEKEEEEAEEMNNL